MSAARLVILGFRRDPRLADNPALQAALRLGKTYPRPVVDHAEARALAADAEMRGAA